MGSLNSSSSISRRLILMRHAKSSWKDLTLTDHERPLNARGRKSAQAVAKKLCQSKVLCPSNTKGYQSLVLSSDAVRTRETWHHMCLAKNELNNVKIKYLPQFYGIFGQSATDQIMESIWEHTSQQGKQIEEEGSDNDDSRIISPDVKTILCLGHNMGWELALNEFVGNGIHCMKTADCFVLEPKTGVLESWEDIFLTRGKWRIAQEIRARELIRS